MKRLLFVAVSFLIASTLVTIHIIGLNLPKVESEKTTSIEQITSQDLGQKVVTEGTVSSYSINREYMNLSNEGNSISIVLSNASEDDRRSIREISRGTKLKIEGEIVNLPRPKVIEEVSDNDKDQIQLEGHLDNSVAQDILDSYSMPNIPEVNNSGYWGSTKIGIRVENIISSEANLDKSWEIRRLDSSKACCIREINGSLAYVKSGIVFPKIVMEGHSYSTSPRKDGGEGTLGDLTGPMDPGLVKDYQFIGGKMASITESTSLDSIQYTSLVGQQRASPPTHLKWGEKELAEDTWRQSNLQEIGGKPVFIAQESTHTRNRASPTRISNHSVYWGEEKLGEYLNIIDLQKHEEKPLYAAYGFKNGNITSKVFLGDKVISKFRDKLILGVESVEGGIAYRINDGGKHYVKFEGKTYGPFQNVEIDQIDGDLIYYYEKNGRKYLNYKGEKFGNKELAENYPLFAIKDPVKASNNLFYVRTNNKTSLLIKNNKEFYRGHIQNYWSINGQIIFKTAENDSRFIHVGKKRHIGPFQKTTRVLETDDGYFFAAKKNGGWYLYQQDETARVYLFDRVSEVRAVSGKPTLLGEQVHEYAGTNKTYVSNRIILHYNPTESSKDETPKKLDKKRNSERDNNLLGDYPEPNSN